MNTKLQSMRKQKRYIPLYLNEDVKPEQVQKALTAVISLLQKRTSKKFYNAGVVETILKSASGVCQGMMYYYDDKAIRFNWKIGQSAKIKSIDFWSEPSDQPKYTLNTAMFNLIDVVNLVSEFIKTQKPVSELIFSEERDSTIIPLRERASQSVENWMSQTNKTAQHLGGLRVADLFRDYKSWHRGLDSNSQRDNKVVSDVYFRRLVGKIMDDAGVSSQYASRATITIAEREEAVEEPAAQAVWDTELFKNLDETEVFDQIFTFTTSVISGDTNSLIVAGDPGIGKTFTIQKILADANKDYKFFSGHLASALQFYKALYENNGYVIVFDDMDSVLKMSDVAMLLKAALDDKEVRRITYASGALGRGEDETPTEFDFTGRIIFITNKYINELDDALLSRSEVVEVDLTPEQVISRIRRLLPEIYPNIGMAIKEEVMEFLLGISYAFRKLDIRTVKKAIKARNSNNPKWQRWVAVAIKAKQKKTR